MKNIYLYSLIIYLLSQSTFGQVKVGSECPNAQHISQDYQLISKSYTLGEIKKLALDIVIKKRNFNKAYLTKIAEKIKLQFCKENIIIGNIFDNKKAYEGWFSDFVYSKIDRRRGVFSFDKTSGEGAIEFSTKAGNPINEVKIEFLIKVQKIDLQLF